MIATERLAAAAADRALVITRVVEAPPSTAFLGAYLARVRGEFA